jgi:hypothetical protein
LRSGRLAQRGDPRERAQSRCCIEDRSGAVSRRDAQRRVGPEAALAAVGGPRTIETFGASARSTATALAIESQQTLPVGVVELVYDVSAG